VTILNFVKEDQFGPIRTCSRREAAAIADELSSKLNASKLNLKNCTMKCNSNDPLTVADAINKAALALGIDVDVKHRVFIEKLNKDGVVIKF